MEATDSNPNTPNNSNASDLTQATGIRVSFIKSCGEEERTQNKMEVGTESHESKTENLQEGKATKAKKDTGSKQDEEKSKVKRNNKALLVTFLGTSSGLPTVDRNVSSLSIRWPNGKIWLIDCGEGTQKQFLRASGHSFVRISTIFITHNHGDHMYGLIPLLAMFTMKGVKQDIEVIGPVGLKKLLETAFEVSQLHISYKLKITELEEGKSYDLGKREEVQVSAYPLKHRVPCFGYVFHEAPIPVFSNELALSKGVPKNLLRKLMDKGEVTFEQNANQVTVKLEDCQIYHRGRHMVFLGDTCNSDEIKEAARGCDLLVHECTFDNTLHDLALSSMHSTPKMAGQFAASVGAKHLIITHFSQRYTGENVSPNVSDLLKDTQAECPNVVVQAANDFFTFEVPKPNQ